jgi:hypothetical protein
MNNGIERSSMEHELAAGSAAQIELNADIVERREVSPEARSVMLAARAERDALRLELARQTVAEAAV